MNVEMNKLYWIELNSPGEAHHPTQDSYPGQDKGGDKNHWSKHQRVPKDWEHCTPKRNHRDNTDGYYSTNMLHYLEARWPLIDWLID